MQHINSSRFMLFLGSKLQLASLPSKKALQSVRAGKREKAKLKFELHTWPI